MGDKARWDRELLSFNYSNFCSEINNTYFHVIDMATLGCQSARYYTLKRLREVKMHLIEHEKPAIYFRVKVGLIYNGVGQCLIDVLAMHNDIELLTPIDNFAFKTVYQAMDQLEDVETVCKSSNKSLRTGDETSKRWIDMIVYRFPYDIDEHYIE